MITSASCDVCGTDWAGCIEGVIYVPCGHPQCGGLCEPDGPCECSCHREVPQ